ncbi:unnamed protein product [Acidithrix sp. C25]|nr:unnamed protein product [Acidithrix sp. C25]
MVVLSPLDWAFSLVTLGYGPEEENGLSFPSNWWENLPNR